MLDDPTRLAKVFALANAVVRPMLRSPLHPALSSRLMLLDYTGGKTGKQYSFAIGYFPWDDGDVISSSTATWPKAMGSARRVRVLIKGRWFEARPVVIKEAGPKADMLGEFAMRNGPRAAKALMLGLPGDRHPDRQQLLAAAAKTTLIRFSLRAAT